ncbi:MAG TPA: SRPBCC domain-containing protein [Bryobacteraceae bacterium]|nr:SRPBCC domain-containing protein [Bryobacteraceae bacterium]
MHLPYRLERTVAIQAPRETVFRYFTDSARWAAWWGAGSTIDAQPGGKVYIRHPNGVETLGEVLQVSIPDRIVFTYGFAGGKPVPAGGSRVTIELADEAAGTRLHLTHEFADEAARDEHVQGWRFQLSLFSNVVANEAHVGAADTVDAWFAAWAEPDESRRAQTLARIATPAVRFRDRFSLLDGQDDLLAHINASLRFMPGIRLQRQGAIRHCQGAVLAEWVAIATEGGARGSGTSVFQLAGDGRIETVTSFRKD